MDYNHQPFSRIADRFALIITPQVCLALFCGLQILLWTFGPWAVRYNLVYDTMESLVWGNQWQWGYDKHPPFTAWLTALFGNATWPSDFGVYLLAQLCVVITFLSVWRLAKEYLDNRSAVLAVIMLTGVLHYSNQVERITPDSMQSPVWALLVLSFYFAVIKQSLRYWVVSGVLAGIALLTKYQAVVLIIPMVISLIGSDRGFSTFKTAGPWVAAMAALLTITPHLLWLHEYNYPPIHYIDDQYVADNSLSESGWLAHLEAPMNFTIDSLGNVALLLLVIWPLHKAPKYYHEKTINHNSFRHTFLYAITLGPMLVSLAFGIWSGEELVSRWSTPYFAWLPLLILVVLNREISTRLFRKIAIRCLLLALILWSLRIGYLYHKPYITTDHWQADEFTPADKAMEKAEALWRENYQTPLPYLGGGHYHVMALTAHSRDHSVPFSNLNQPNSLWMTEADFRNKGGIIVVEKNITDFRTEDVEDKYPQAVYLGTFRFRPYIPADIDNAKHSIVSYYLLPPET